MRKMLQKICALFIFCAIFISAFSGCASFSYKDNITIEKGNNEVLTSETYKEESVKILKDFIIEIYGEIIFEKTGKQLTEIKKNNCILLVNILINSFYDNYIKEVDFLKITNLLLLEKDNIKNVLLNVYEDNINNLTIDKTQILTGHFCHIFGIETTGRLFYGFFKQYLNYKNLLYINKYSETKREYYLEWAEKWRNRYNNFESLIKKENFILLIRVFYSSFAFKNSHVNNISTLEKTQLFHIMGSILKDINIEEQGWKFLLEVLGESEIFRYATELHKNNELLNYGNFLKDLIFAIGESLEKFTVSDVEKINDKWDIFYCLFNYSSKKSKENLLSFIAVKVSDSTIKSYLRKTHKRDEYEEYISKMQISSLEDVMLSKNKEQFKNTLTGYANKNAPLMAFLVFGRKNDTSN